MKKWIISLLCVVLAVQMCACTGGSGDTETSTGATTTASVENVQNDSPLTDGKTLKLLAITSSFGLNTTEYLYDIAVAHGAEDVIVGRLYFSGCSLEEHVTYANENAMKYTYTKIDSETGHWQTMDSVNMDFGIKDEDWDIIFIQQSAHESSQVDTYKDYIDQLMEYVNKTKTNPNARYIWNLTWAFQGDCTDKVFDLYNKDQLKMYQSIVNAVNEKVLPRTDIAAISPTGTAIQNVRTSYIGDTLTRDTLHLNELGRIIAGYTLYGALTDKPIESFELGYVDGMPALTDTDKALILEAVNAALEKPFEVTQSSYTERPAV